MSYEDDARVIKKILDRYQSFYPHNVPYASISLAMRACNEFCPLDYEKLLASNEVHFVHDVSGIVNNTSPFTGQLLNGFRPHCAKEIKQ